jgi:hypothetical protein
MNVEHKPGAIRTALFCSAPSTNPAICEKCRNDVGRARHIITVMTGGFKRADGQRFVLATQEKCPSCEMIQLLPCSFRYSEEAWDIRDFVGEYSKVHDALPNGYVLVPMADLIEPLGEISIPGEGD